MKLVITLVLLAIVGVLASAGVLMLRRREHDGHRQRDMARALALRVALSIALFAFVLFSWHMGWVKPGGLPVGG